MQVYTIHPLGFAANTYLVTADGKTAVAIDPSQPRVLEQAKELGLSVTHVLLTHGHFDHIGGCSALQAAGAQVGCITKEKELALYHNLSDEAYGKPVPPFTIDFTFEDGAELDLCGLKIKVVATPGHTAGSCCLLAEGALFSGDTLFLHDIGRTDLPTSSDEDMANSLARLRALEGDYAVYPGHGGATTLENERAHNEYLRAC